ncbi:hypothetical protein DRQ05_05165, partial [bacterium]
MLELTNGNMHGQDQMKMEADCKTGPGIGSIEQTGADSSTFELLTNIVLTDIANLVSFDFGLLFLLESGELKLKSFTGIDEVEITCSSIPVGEGFSGKIFSNGEPLLFEDIGIAREDFDFSLEPFYRGSVLSVPFGIAFNNIGLINLCRLPAKPPFTEDDLRALAAYGYQVAFTLASQQLVTMKISEMENVRLALAKVNEQLKSELEEKAKAERKIQIQYEEIQKQFDELRQMKEQLERRNEDLMKMALELRESEEKHRLLIERGSDGILIVLGDEIKYSNPKFLEITGSNEDEVLGAPLERFILEGEVENVKEHLHSYSSLKDEGEIIGTKILRSDGAVVEVEMNSTPILYEDEIAVLVFVRDVTERNNLERRLQQGQKLESIGRLAAGIAHEINTPTQYVGDNTRFLKDAF